MNEALQQDKPYLLVAKIGEGGMAEVFKALKKGPDGWEKPIALKRILPHLATDPTFIGMLSSEARLHAKLDHPNLVQVVDFFEHDKTFFLAMEYVPGKNLRQIQHKLQEEKESLPWEISVHVVSETLKGLFHVHSKRDSTGPLRIVHRDISPQNILISYEGLIKLSDFGIAHANIERERTQSGVLKGKQRYLSPEQIEGKPVTAHSDLFSMGVVLYEALAGIHPFDAPTAFESMKRITEIKYSPLSSIRQDLPTGLAEITHRALQREPQGRFEDAREFRRALLEVQPASWVASGTEHLSTFMDKLFPDRKDLAEEPLEPTPLLAPESYSSLTSKHTEGKSSPLISSTEAEASRKKPSPRTLVLGFIFLFVVGVLFAYVNPWHGQLEEVSTQGLERQEPPIIDETSLVPKKTSTPQVKPEPTKTILPPVEKNPPKKVEKKAVAPKSISLGKVFIKEPRGYEIFINGKKVGISPVRISLPPRKGGYLIWGVRGKNRSIVERIEVQPRKEKSYTLKFLQR